MEWVLVCCVGILGSVCVAAGLNLFIHLFVSFDNPIPKGVIKKQLTLSSNQLAYLAKKNSYYQTLPTHLKKPFENRVLHFINHKKFIPRGYTHVNEEMKALIASAAVQLTFGFKQKHFPHFWRILVYQDDYYSKITQKYHQGEVHPQGFIVLSWRNILKGFDDATDGRNLALHEMAHALHLENAIANGEYGFLGGSEVVRFEKLAELERAKMKRGQSYLFRAYAVTNKYEFFAVAIEHFFERPAYFLKEAPELYAALVGVLKQNPMKFLEPKS